MQSTSKLSPVYFSLYAIHAEVVTDLDLVCMRSTLRLSPIRYGLHAIHAEAVTDRIWSACDAR
eukprot:3197479-Pleurochrysis_carterae.AAC.1